MREERPDIICLVMMSQRVELSDGQFFCDTPKAYEIWQRSPLRLIKRIPAGRVIAVQVSASQIRPVGSPPGVKK